MWNFQEVFLIVLLSLLANLKLMSVLFIHEKVLVYKLETFTNCKEVKHIMIMIIAVIYIFYVMRYLMNSWKLLSENPQLPPWRNPPSILLPFLETLYIFQAPPAERGLPFGGGGYSAFFSKNGLVLPIFGWIK